MVKLQLLDLPVILVDGVHFRDRMVLIALGIDSEGRKHVLGLREGSTENATVVRALIGDLVERGVDHERSRLWVIDGAKALRRAIQDAWASRDPVLGLRQLERLARSLEREHPGAAASLREGLQETLTVQRLGIDGALARTLKTTNPIENMNGAVAHHTRNVRRWRDAQMLLRWVGAALHEAQRGFRRIRGHRDLRKLCAALERQRNVPIVTSDRKAA